MERQTKRRRNSAKYSSQQISSSIQTTTKTRRLATDFYLPDECWESIFKFTFSDSPIYNSCYFKSISLVSKRFLAISNRVIFSLVIHDSTHPFLSRLFQRFTNLNSLDLSRFNGDINALLCEISRFSLKLTSLKLFYKPTMADGLRAFSQNIKTLTSLTYSGIPSINDTDLFLIGDCFPLLEELDLRHPTIKLADHESLRNGLKALSSKLFKLHKVNLTSHYYINDQLLFHLFKNWKYLEEADISNCCKLTNAGIASALRERPTLRSLSFSSHFEPKDRATFFALAALVSNSPSLSEISLHYKSENSVENSNHLMDFVVNPQLKSLCLNNYRIIRDESVKIFVSIFPNLQLLNLSYCWNISEEVIYHVLKRCCKIRHLDLTGCSLKLRGLNFEIPKLEVLNLSKTIVDDETLYVISKNCRGLKQLLLKFCYKVTKKGVKHVVENCTQLREINLKGCRYKIEANVVASMVFSRPLLRLHR